MSNIRKEQIEALIAQYNTENPERPLRVLENVKDVSKLYICFYNEEHTALFTKIPFTINYKPETSLCPETYTAGNLYLGVDNELVGAKITHEDIFDENLWMQSGKRIVLDDQIYITNCYIRNGMLFDAMRTIMHKKGLIPEYTIGFATNEEIVQVLTYASEYYNVNKIPEYTKRVFCGGKM